MNSIKLLPLGGLGEVGMNSMLMEYSGVRIVIDCGVLSSNQPLLGFDGLLPNIDLLSGKKIDALVISHAHEDHIGGISYFLNDLQIERVFCTQFCFDLIKTKLSSYQIKNNHFEIVDYGVSHQVGDFFVTYHKTSHSIVEASLLEIKSPIGNIIHSGDFKIDYDSVADTSFNDKDIENLGPCHLLLSDSTNSEKDGYSLSEKKVYENMLSVIKKESGNNIFVSCFSSNIHRLKSLLQVAKKTNRRIVFLGKALWKYYDIALRNAYLSINDSQPLYVEDIEDGAKDIIFICTGSQGSYNAALAKVLRKELPPVEMKEGDLYIHSALKIPGNHINIRYLLNEISQTGCRISHLSEEGLHASGHAYKQEQIHLARLLKPRFFIPVHGDYHMLRSHIENLTNHNLVEKALLLQNGEEALLYEDKLERNEKHLATKLWYRGSHIGRMDDLALKERKKIARDGVCFFVAFYENGKFFEKPFLDIIGYEVSEDLKKNLINAIMKKLENKAIDQKVINNIIKKELRSFLGWTPSIHSVIYP